MDRKQRSQRHSLVRSLELRHSLGHSLVLRHNRIHMVQPFRLHTMDPQPMYRSKS
jgi:hypothetical protein